MISILTIAATSCTKESDSIGLDVQPPTDRLGTNFTDTTQIIAYSVKEDSIITSNLSQNIVGFIKDPYFGSTQAGFATQFHLPTRDVQFTGNPILDSVVLVISYRGFYGDTNSAVNFKVYELNQDFNADSSYYQNTPINVKPKPINSNPSAYYQTRISTPVMSSQDTTMPQFRIKLSTSWGQHKIFDKSGQSELSDNANLKNHFKGLYITAEDAMGLGHMVYLGINESTVSGIYFYYHTSEANLTFRLLVEKTCARINHYDHNGYHGALSAIQNQVNNNQTSLGANQLYLHPGGGINTFVQFPTVKEQFKGRRVVINRAELVITNVVPNTKGFYVPQQLTLAKKSSTGSYLFTPDDAITEGDDYFGGFYNASTNEYRFRITRYIQEILNSDNPDYGLTLFISGRAVVSNRLIFMGYRKGLIAGRLKPLRLELSYTYLD